jgi:hypothetical protein
MTDGNMSTPLSATCADFSQSSTWRLLSFTDTIHLYCLPVLILAGVVLNSVNFVVFRSSTLRLYAFGVYIPSLAVIDSVALVSQMPRRWLNLLYETVGWGRGVTPYDTVDVACKSLTLLSGTSQFASAWTLVAMASERTSVALNPYRLTRIRQARTARFIVLATCVAAVLVNCHVLVAWRSALPTTDVGVQQMSDSTNVTSTQNIAMLSFDRGRLFGHVTTRHDLTQCRPEVDSVLVLVVMMAADALLFPVPVAILCILAAISVRGLVVTSRVERCRRLSVDLTSRLRAERNVIVMIVWLTACHIALALPRLVTWSVRLYFWLVAGAAGCIETHKDRAAAANDVAELVFTVNYVVKFLICIMSGRDVISQI